MLNKNKIVVLASVFIGFISVHLHAQTYFNVVHKPTGLKLSSCATENGTQVESMQVGVNDCAKWQQIETTNGFFHLENKVSQKFIRPAGAANGSPIVVQPNTWTGNWTQWRFQDTGDGYGYLVNRNVGTHMFLPSTGGGVESRPSSWTGDFTRWQLQAVTENPFKVRIIYHIPADDEERADYKQLMEESVAVGQAWVQEQLGKTYTLADNGEATVVKSTQLETSFQIRDDATGVNQVWDLIRNDVIDILGPGSNSEARIIFSSVDSVPLPNNDCISAGAANNRLAIVSGDDLRGLAQEGTLCSHIGEFDINRWYGGQLHEALHMFTVPHPVGADNVTPTPGYEGQCQDDQCIMRFGWISFPNTYLTPSDRYLLNRSPFLGREFDQSYNLRNVNSDKCIDLPFVNTMLGTPLFQFFCFADSPNFQWQITPVGEYVQIENNLSLNCLNVANGSLASGEAIDTSRCDGGDSSLWDIQEQTDGTVIIQNKLTGLCTTVENDSLEDVGNIVQENCNAASATWNLNAVDHF